MIYRFLYTLVFLLLFSSITKAQKFDEKYSTEISGKAIHLASYKSSYGLYVLYVGSTSLNTIKGNYYSSVKNQKNAQITALPQLKFEGNVKVFQMDKKSIKNFLIVHTDKYLYIFRLKEEYKENKVIYEWETIVKDNNLISSVTADLDIVSSADKFYCFYRGVQGSPKVLVTSHSGTYNVFKEESLYSKNFKKNIKGSSELLSTVVNNVIFIINKDNKDKFTCLEMGYFLRALSKGDKNLPTKNEVLSMLTFTEIFLSPMLVYANTNRDILVRIWRNKKDQWEVIPSQSILKYADKAVFVIDDCIKDSKNLNFSILTKSSSANLEMLSYRDNNWSSSKVIVAENVENYTLCGGSETHYVVYQTGKTLKVLQRDVD